MDKSSNSGDIVKAKDVLYSDPQLRLLDEQIDCIMNGIHKILLSKRKLYGSGSINATGVYGQALMLLHKGNRAEQLAKTYIFSDSGIQQLGPASDVLRDSFVDAIGYSIMGLILLDGGKW